MEFRGAIQACLREFLKEYKTPYEINDGACEDFMQCVIEKVPKASDRSSESVDGEYTLLPGHVWIFYRGKHYDAETINGVKNWKDLPVFKKYYQNIKNKTT